MATEELAMYLLIILFTMCICSFMVGYEFARELWDWQGEALDEWYKMYWKLWNMTK